MNKLTQSSGINPVLLRLRRPGAKMSEFANRSMAFTISTTRFPQFAQLTVSGPASVKDFIDLIATLEQETIYWSDRRALVDLRNVVGPLTTTEQIFLGELVAQNLRHLDRIASVVSSEEITRSSETAAQQLGVYLRLFTARDEAVAWLMADPIHAMRKTEHAAASAARFV